MAKSPKHGLDTTSGSEQSPPRQHDTPGSRGATPPLNADASVSADDFGTGYSSLSCVASLPIHALKIDRSFVKRMTESNRTRSVIAATTSPARSLGIRTVAEGADARDQGENQIAMSCTGIQSFYFSRPVEAGALRLWTEEFSLEAYGLCPVAG